MQAAIRTNEWMALDRTIYKLYITENESVKEELLMELLPQALEMLKGKLSGDRVTLVPPTLPESDGKMTISEATERFSLTKREHTILRTLLDGKDNDEICDELAISVNTLKKHILNIYRKMGIRNRVQLFKMVRERE